MILKNIQFINKNSVYEAIIQPSNNFSIHLSSDNAGTYTIGRSIAPNSSEDNEGYYTIYTSESAEKVLDTSIVNWLPGVYCKITSNVPLNSACYG